MAYDWVYCRKAGCRDGDVLAFSDLARAIEGLRPLKAYGDAMLVLRLTLWYDDAVRVWDLSDDAVIALAAGAIISGRFHVHAEGRGGVATELAGLRHEGGAVIAGVAASEEPAAPAAAPPPRRQAAAPAAAPPDQPVFGDIDEAAQADALAAAAAEGKPFCPE